MAKRFNNKRRSTAYAIATLLAFVIVAAIIVSFVGVVSVGKYDLYGASGLGSRFVYQSCRHDISYLGVKDGAYVCCSTYRDIQNKNPGCSNTITYSLSVSSAGTGSGTVASVPGGISCGTTCTSQFNAGSAVVLTATPSAGSTFSGWSGACSGTGTCAVTVDSSTSVTANYKQTITYYAISASISGSGLVESNPSGLSCGSSACSGTFSSGTSVTLTATPASGYAFAGWSGDCSGTGSCTFVLGANKSVVATFNPIVVSAQSKACGIFALDDKSGTYRTGNINSAYKPFVNGYSWRMGWGSFESSQGNYNFAAVDYIIPLLEAQGKKLSINGAISQEPDYVVNHAGTTTWTESRNPGGASVTVKHPVPWDAFAQQRYAAYVSALANHQVYSSTLGKMVALKDHPTLVSINLGMVGMGSIRDNLSAVSGYTRNGYENSVLFSLKTQTDNFPTKQVFVGFWVVNDSTKSPSLTDDLTAKILAQHNGVANPKVGFFMENLAATKSGSTVSGTPTTGYAAPEYSSRNQTPVMFQALQAWCTTQGCFKQDSAKTTGTTPDDGINYGYSTFNAKYYEIYVSDLATSSYTSAFTSWNTKLCQ